MVVGRERVGSTGVTAGGLLDFTNRTRPDLGVSEQADGWVKPEQSDIILQIFAKIDYAYAAAWLDLQGFDYAENRKNAFGVAYNSLPMGSTWSTTLGLFIGITEWFKKMALGFCEVRGQAP